MGRAPPGTRARVLRKARHEPWFLPAARDRGRACRYTEHQSHRQLDLIDGGRDAPINPGRGRTLAAAL